MGGGTFVVPPDPAVGFSWVLSSLQVVGDRDHRKQYQDQDGKRDQLDSAVSPRGRGRTKRKMKPEEKNKGGNCAPCEIEEKLHSQR